MNLLVCLLYRNYATLQRPGSCSFDLHFHKIAGLNTVLLFRLWEEDEFVRPVAAFPLSATMTGVVFFNQHLFDFAQILLVNLMCNGGLKFLDGMKPALFLVQGNVIFPTRCDGSRP